MSQSKRTARYLLSLSDLVLGSAGAVRADSWPYLYYPRAAHITGCESYCYFPTNWRPWPISPPPVISLLPAPSTLPAPTKVPAEPPKKTQGAGQLGPTADFRPLPSR